MNRKQFLFFVTIISILCAGCGPAVTETHIIEIAIAVKGTSLLTDYIINFLTYEEKLNFYEHFIRKRIRFLIEKDSSYDDYDGHYASLAQRLLDELKEVKKYINEKLGTPDSPGPLGGLTDSHAFPHTDLEDVTKTRIDDGVATIQRRKKEFLEGRRNRVRSIIWRACAIHPSVWKDTAQAELEKQAFDELLDRRLRLTERILYTDNAQEGKREWSIDSGTANWKDKLRTVLFEYPRLYIKRDRSDDLSKAIISAGLSLDSTDAGYFNNDFETTDYEIKYKAGGRVPTESQAYWSYSGYRWKMSLNGKTPAEIFDILIPPAHPVDSKFEDFWNRIWMYCDQMVALLSIDAMRFGMRRRTGGDTDFNNAVGTTMVATSIFNGVTQPDPSSIIANGNTYFEGILIDASEIQTGDWGVLWNNYFLREIIKDSYFGLENTVVSDVQGTKLNNIRVVGHGMSEGNYENCLESLVNDLKSLIKKFREKITTQINSAFPANDYLQFHGLIIPARHAMLYHKKISLVYWPPFGENFIPYDNTQEIKVPGAWWLRVDSQLSQEQAQILYPNSVVIDANLHTVIPKPIPGNNDEDTEADYLDAIYVPLSVPYGVKGGWKGYFQKAKDMGDETFLLSGSEVKLVDTKVDSSWVPGFFYAGPDKKFPVVRPKLRI